MQDMIQQIREAGARIKLIDAGDVAGAINTAFDHTGVDILLVWWCTRRRTCSCCFKMSRWRIQGKLLPQNDEESRTL